MPRRNLIIVFLAVILSMVCYQRADRTPYASVFSHVLHLISDRYVDHVEPRVLFEGAMQGMVDQLDEHSAFIGPDLRPEFQADLDQEFGGIGIRVVVDVETERLVVMSPLIDTPAYEAGMRAGDIILSINGRDTRGMPLHESVEIMRGKPGTKLRLSVLHPGDEQPVDLELTRAEIQTESVLGDFRGPSGKWKYHLEEDPRIGYIRITTFGEQTVDEMHRALKTYDRQPVAALIIDLRNNPGGYLTAAVEICDMFISTGRIVSSRGRDEKYEQVEYAHAAATIVAPDVPLAVLVNKYSASASEIVAACVKDHGRAKIIGTRTWGKGTVQNVIPIEAGNSVLKLTTAHYWRPSNKNIHRRRGAGEEEEWGVKPSPGFEVELSKEEFENVLLQRRERDVVRTDENGEVQPPAATPAPSEGEGHGGDGSGGKQDTEPDDGDAPPEGPVDDPQLRKAINYLLGLLAKRRLAA